MSNFTTETIEQVREGADIVEVVSAYTDLRRQGERFVGLCPFHDERTPSFSVKPRDGFYYCFGCEAGGDTIRFVQEKESLSFPDAVEALADRFGIEVTREQEDPQAEERRRRLGRLGQALERAAAFYEAFLWNSSEAAKARDYLLGRKLSEETLRAFGVGYAPSGWDSVLVRGQRAGFIVPELQAAGLVIPGQKGGHYDVFRSRITFPIRDRRGRALGFGARAMGEAMPKYKNTAESDLYRKGRTLYGIDRAKGPIARAGRAVVVEGYTDVLALHQAGTDNAVAVMGTAITPEQLKLLTGYAEEVVLALDADRAGTAAMLRAQRVAGSGKLRMLVASMPEGEDPADVLGGVDGAKRLEAALGGAVDLPVFHVRSILADADLETPPGRDRALDEAAPVLAAMGETITQSELIREVADKLDADPSLVVTRMRQGGRGGGRPPTRRSPQADSAEPGTAVTVGRGDGESRPVATAPPTATVEPGSAGHERREETLLAMCIAAPKIGAGYVARLTPEHLSTAASRKALDWLREHLVDPLAELPADDEELAGEVRRLTMLADREPATEASMEVSWMILERRRLESEIAAATEAEGATAELVALQRERATLDAQIRRGV